MLTPTNSQCMFQGAHTSRNSFPVVLVWRSFDRRAFTSGCLRTWTLSDIAAIFFWSVSATKFEAEGRAAEQNGERFEVDGGEWRGCIRRNEAGSGATPAPATIRLA